MINVRKTSVELQVEVLTICLEAFFFFNSWALGGGFHDFFEAALRSGFNL